jgi:hypothetical protein
VLKERVLKANDVKCDSASINGVFYLPFSRHQSSIVKKKKELMC